MSAITRGLATADNYGATRLFKVLAKSADYTVTADDLSRNGCAILMTTGASSRTVSLPAASTVTNRRVTIKKVDSGAGTTVIDPDSTETVDGLSTITLYKANESVTLVSNGSNWFIIAADWATGTYTPTVTEVANLDSDPTGNATRYWRNGPSIVVVSGVFSVDPTSATPTATSFRVSLPIASNFANAHECSGTAARFGGGTANYENVRITADTANNEALFEFSASNTSGANMAFTFTYTII